MKSLLAGGATAALLLVGAVTAAPALADPPVAPMIQVATPLTSSGSGDVEVTGTYQCDPAVTHPAISVTVTQNAGAVTQSARVSQKACDGSPSQPFKVSMFGAGFVSGAATYEADLVDRDSGDAVLVSDPVTTGTNKDTTITTPPTDPGPGKVTNLTSTKTTTSSITISWSPPSTLGAGPDVYTVSVAPSNGSSPTSGASPFTFTGLKPATTYTLSVRATDSQGMSALNSITRTTSALPKPPPPRKPPRKPRRIALHVTIHTTHTHVRPTGLDVIHGLVRPHHRVRVELQRRVDGVWVAANSGIRRTSGGHYHFEIRPVTKFVGRVVIVATKKFKASTSKSVVIHVTH
jgi:Fibronectin type III domain